MSLNQKIEDKFGQVTDIARYVESNETLDTIFNHRSVREFSKRQVEEDFMKTLLTSAFCGPSKSDLQQARVIWIKDPKIKQSIADLSPDLHPWIATAPEFVIWCGDNSLSHILAESHAHPYVNNHLDQFMNPAVDAGIAMATFTWAAESKGLYCCPVSSIRNTPFELARILNLPKFVFPVAGMVVGYPKEDLETPVSMRLPLSVLIMENQYRDDSSEIFAEIEDYSARRQAKQAIPPEKQRGIEEFGLSDNYGWTEDKTRQYSKPERTDWGDFIKNQGFILE